MATTSLGIVGTIDWTDWIRGLLAGAISGGANSVYAGFGSILVDSKDFNIYSGKLYGLMGVTFGLSALMAAMNYLRVKPIPEYKKTTETEERSPHSTVVTGTGDGSTIEERSPHATKITKVVEEVKPAGTITTVIDPPKTTITESSDPPKDQ